MQETKTAAGPNPTTAKNQPAKTGGNENNREITTSQVCSRCLHGIDEPQEVVVDGALVTCPCDCRDEEPLYITDHLESMLRIANSHTGDTKFQGFICDANSIQEAHVWAFSYARADIAFYQTAIVRCDSPKDIKTAILSALSYTTIGGAAESYISKALDTYITRHDGQKTPEAPQFPDTMKAAQVIKAALPDDCYATSVTICSRSHSRDRYELSVSIHGPDYFYQATQWDLPNHPSAADIKECLSRALKCNLTPVKVKRTTPIHRRYVRAAMHALDALDR